MVIRKTEFKVEHNDGTKETIILDVQGEAHWEWYLWSNVQEITLMNHLKSRGHTKLPRNISYCAGI